MNFPHGLLFHHFWNDTHPNGQGAIDAGGFENILQHAGIDNFLRAEDWLARARAGQLLGNHLCVTFDDGLRCQYDVALPVLEKYNLTAFWFVYTAPIVGEFDQLEIFRHFRTTSFADISEFYDAFNRFILESEYADLVEAGLQGADTDRYLGHAPFYSREDRRFRFIRNEILGSDQYACVMGDLMRVYDYDRDNVACELWLSKDQIGVLKDKNHVIGLHSHTHPTSLAGLARSKQYSEFKMNKSILEGILDRKIETGSYPCNSYTEDTISVMEELGIDVAFRADMGSGGESLLEVPRINHAIFMKEMKNSSN